MKTNLAYIESAVSGALAHEMDNPPIPEEIREKAKKARLRIVAGMQIADSESENAILEVARQKRRAQIDAYRSDRGKVIGDLRECGVVPLAVLPKAAWERICARSRLFRLNPDSRGIVAISTRLIGIAEHRGESMLAWGYLLGILLFVNVALLFTRSIPLTLIATLLAACAGYPFLNLGNLSKDFRRGLVRNQIENLVRISWTKTLYDLFPGGESPADARVYANLVLPRPPPDVEEILRKVKGLRLKVAAVPGAISFLEPISALLLREYVREEEELERKQRDALQRELERIAREHDPIVYREYGNAVAIIAQFGDFPIEKQVVDEVIGSEFLL